MFRFFLIVAIALVAMRKSAKQDDDLVQRFRQLDRDTDGKLNQQELQGFPYVQRVDRDSDCNVTMAQLGQMLARIRRSTQQPKATGGGKSPKTQTVAIKAQGKQRCYELFLPSSSYRKGSAMPVVLVFQGGGGGRARKT